MSGGLLSSPLILEKNKFNNNLFLDTLISLEWF